MSPRASASGVASSTVAAPSCLPADRADAKTRTWSKPRARSRSSVTVPTAPVPPTTPMRRCSPKVERLVERTHGGSTCDASTWHAILIDEVETTAM